MVQPVPTPLTTAEDELVQFALKALATVLPGNHPRRNEAAALFAELSTGRLWLYKAVPPEDKPDDRG